MNNKPLFSALGAALYIIAIATLMGYLTDKPGVEETMIVPVTMLSLLVLSVAVMAYLFLNEPVRLYFDNKKSEAIGAFVKTVIYFAVFALISIVIFISTT